MRKQLECCWGFLFRPCSVWFNVIRTPRFYCRCINCNELRTYLDKKCNRQILFCTPTISTKKNMMTRIPFCCLFSMRVIFVFSGMPILVHFLAALRQPFSGAASRGLKKLSLVHNTNVAISSRLFRLRSGTFASSAGKPMGSSKNGFSFSGRPKASAKKFMGEGVCVSVASPH